MHFILDANQPVVKSTQCLPFDDSASQKRPVADRLALHFTKRLAA
jgi:hypothetical protein